jgi:hypothetical protein
VLEFPSEIKKGYILRSGYERGIGEVSFLTHFLSLNMNAHAHEFIQLSA